MTLLNMNCFFIQHSILYDGSQLRMHSALNIVKSLNVPQTPFAFGDSAVIFIGPMQVTPDKHMVDLEDVLGDDPIYSQNALQFIIEHFDIPLELCIYRQLLLMNIIRDILVKTFCFDCSYLTLDGDDIMLGDRKLSVSICTTSAVSKLIHVGLNITKVDSAKVKAKTTSFEELLGLQFFQGIDFLKLGEKIISSYDATLSSIITAKAKVLPVS